MSTLDRPFLSPRWIAALTLTFALSLGTMATMPCYAANPDSARVDKKATQDRLKTDSDSTKNIQGQKKQKIQPQQKVVKSQPQEAQRAPIVSIYSISALVVGVLLGACITIVMIYSLRKRNQRKKRRNGSVTLVSEKEFNKLFNADSLNDEEKEKLSIKKY